MHSQIVRPIYNTYVVRLPRLYRSLYPGSFYSGPLTLGSLTQWSLTRGSHTLGTWSLVSHYKVPHLRIVIVGYLYPGPIYTTGSLTLGPSLPTNYPVLPRPLMLVSLTPHPLFWIFLSWTPLPYKSFYHRSLYHGFPPYFITLVVQLGVPQPTFPNPVFRHSGLPSPFTWSTSLWGTSLWGPIPYDPWLWVTVNHGPFYPWFI